MIEHADNPQKADVWRDHGVHVCTVLQVTKESVTCKWGHPDRGPVMSRAAFARFLRYDTIPDKTWAHCTRK